ncbi:MAG: ribbon-helix-helix protein, CopG family [Chloroflexota bacterium]|nr:MAG: ribbon-helix-helix protein, CopG family [Chloroflexota bacterium]
MQRRQPAGESLPLSARLCYTVLQIKVKGQTDMPSRHLSLRLEPSTIERLDDQSRRLGQSRSQLAKTLLEEGLRMEAHPGIVFRSGPAGRRPGLAGGPDVWEVVRVFTGIDARGEAAIAQTSQLTGLRQEQVRVALSYYADYREEIDHWIQLIDGEASRAEASWQRQQDILGQ